MQAAPFEKIANQDQLLNVLRRAIVILLSLLGKVIETLLHPCIVVRFFRIQSDYFQCLGDPLERFKIGECRES